MKRIIKILIVILIVLDIFKVSEIDVATPKLNKKFKEIPIIKTEKFQLEKIPIINNTKIGKEMQQGKESLLQNEKVKYADLSRLFITESELKESFMPLKNLLTTKNADGSIEVSGVLEAKKMQYYEQKGSGVDKTIKTVIQLFSFENNDISFYIKGKIEHIGNETYINVYQASVNKCNVPSFILKGKKKVSPPFTSIIED